MSVTRAIFRCAQERQIRLVLEALRRSGNDRKENTSSVRAGGILTSSGNDWRSRGGGEEEYGLKERDEKSDGGEEDEGNE